MSKLQDILSPTDSYRIEALVRELEICRETDAAFANFTDHGVRHSERLISLLDEAMSDESKSNLTPLEIFILISSAYLHDVGLTYPKYNNRWVHSITGTLLAAAAFHDISYVLSLTQVGVASASLRLMHSRLSSNFVSRKYRRLGLTKHEAEVVSQICGMHSNPARIAELQRRHTLSRQVVRTKLIASLLRFGDDLEVSAPRVNSLAALLLIRDELQERPPGQWSDDHTLQQQYIAKIESQALNKVKDLPPISVVFHALQKTVLLLSEGPGEFGRRIAEYIAQNTTDHLAGTRQELQRIGFPYERVEAHVAT